MPQMLDEDGNEAELLPAERSVNFVRHVAGSDFATWDAAAVCVWLESLGLSTHTTLFKKHGVTGRQLVALNEAHLIELGIVLIGDRLRLLNEIAVLKATRTQSQLDAVLWEGVEVPSFAGICDYHYKKCLRPCCRKLACQRPGFLDVYKLTTTALVVTQRDRTVLEEAVCCGRAITQTTRYIDLDTIISASTSSSQKLSCDYGIADVIAIEVDKMTGQRPIHPMVVAHGTGAAVVAEIMEAIYEQHLARADGHRIRPQKMDRAEK